MEQHSVFVIMIVVGVVIGFIIARTIRDKPVRHRPTEEEKMHQEFIRSVSTPEDQEALDRQMDLTAKRAAIHMYKEHLLEKRIWEAKNFTFLDGKPLPFCNIAIIPPFATVIHVVPGQKSRHEDGGYERLVMELYNKLIEDGKQN